MLHHLTPLYCQNGKKGESTVLLVGTSPVKQPARFMANGTQVVSLGSAVSGHLGWQSAACICVSVSFLRAWQVVGTFKRSSKEKGYFK